VHSEGTRDSSTESERAETYLRLLSEAALRRTAPGEETLVKRVWRAADVLIEAGALPGARAAEILVDLSTALRARSGMWHFTPATGVSIGRLASFLPPRSLNPAERWRVIPADRGVVPGSRLMALVLAPDQVLAPATLRFPPSAGLPELQVPPWADLSATDNLGTRYRITFANGTWAGSTWTGTIMLRPAPPDAARWITIASQNGQLLRAEIPATPGGGGGGGGGGDGDGDGGGPSGDRGGAGPGEDMADSGATIRPVRESPGERLLARRAEAMLAALPSGGLAQGHAASKHELAELIEILEAAGLLSPLSAVPRQLAGLGQLLGLLGDGPVSEVPPRWRNVVAYYGRRRRLSPPTGTAAIGVALPELDGVLLAIAGLRTGSSGSYLHVVARGLPALPHRSSPGQPGGTVFSFWVMDDIGMWHLAVIEEASPAGGAMVLRLALLPPLGHAAATATIEVTGVSRQITANLPVHW
jgi:hypothetical protein